LLVGAWVGAMAGFAATAPQVFAAFGPDRQAAGTLAGQMIWRLNVIGLVLGALALVILLFRLGERVNRWRSGLLAAALVLALFGALYIFPQMEKAQPPRPIQEYAETDPIRVTYNQWHERSRQVFGGAILLGAGVVILGSARKESR
jgi:MFS family permease